MASSEIEPATFRRVAPCLKRLRHRVLHIYYSHVLCNALNHFLVRIAVLAKIDQVKHKTEANYLKIWIF